MYVIFIAVDENIDYVGYAVVRALVPEDENAASTVIASGTCGGQGDGSNLTWTMTGGGVCTVSGTGRMANYSEGSDPGYAGDERPDHTGN